MTAAPVDEHPVATYATAHDIYRRAGWPGPLPLRDGTKWPPPEGWTGWTGGYPSYADSTAWCDPADYGDTAQLALRMGDTVVGLDVDHYGDKRGGDTMAEAERRWGPLPPAPYSSARGPGASGIHFYRVPHGTVLRTKIGFPDLHLGSVEVIQRHHRYAVVWPSTHPSGQPYLWHDTAGPDRPPHAEHLNELPVAWLEALAGAQTPGEAEADPATVTAFAREHTGTAAPAMLRGALAVFERQAEHGTRHDAMVEVTCMAAREARAGCYPAGEAVVALRDAFIRALAEARAGQRLVAPSEARHEFDSMWGWAVGQALALTPEEARGRVANLRPPVSKVDRAVSARVAEPGVAASVRPDHLRVVDEQETAAPGGMDPASGWRPVDLEPYLTGTIERPQPAVGLYRRDGVRLFYPGKEHAVIGEMEAGKSWICLASVVAELQAGNAVVYVHFEEEDATDTVQRLLLLGATPDQIRGRFSFIAPSYAITPDIAEHLIALGPTLVILDGQNEAMSLHGMGIREEDGAAAYRRALVRPFTAAGVCVISCDHVVKDSEKSAKGYALGSIHKGNGISGTIVLVESEEPFGTGRRGASRVYVTKDRPGQVRQFGQPTPIARKFYMGTVSVDATAEDGALELLFWPPSDRDKVDPFGLVEHWHDVLAESAALPDDMTRLAGKGASAARDIFRVLRYVDDPDGLTTSQLQQALREGTREHAKSTFLAGRAMLLKSGICDEGATPSKIVLASRFTTD